MRQPLFYAYCFGIEFLIIQKFANSVAVGSFLCFQAVPSGIL